MSNTEDFALKDNRLHFALASFNEEIGSSITFGT
jgi:hypothetical protein